MARKPKNPSRFGGLNLIDIVMGSLSLLSLRQKIAIYSLSIARVLTNLLDVFGLAIIGLIGTIAVGSPVDIVSLDFLGLDDESLLVLLLAVAGVGFVLKTVFGLLLARFTVLYLAKIEVLFADELAKHIFTGEFSDVRGKSQPEIEWAILRSSNRAFPGVLGQLMSLLAEASLALMIFCFLVLTDWQLAIAVAVYFALILLAFQGYSSYVVKSLGAEFAESSVAVSQSLVDLTAAHRELRILSKTSIYLDRLSHHRARAARADALNLYLSAIPRLLVELGLIVGVVLFVASQLVFGNGIGSLVTLGVFLMGSLRMMSALLPLQRSFHYLKFEGALALSAQDLLRRYRGMAGTAVPENVPSRNSVSSIASGFTGNGVEIAVSGLSFEYDDNEEKVTVLQDVSFNVEGGSTVALIGPSGAGKSTLVDLMLGLLRPGRGNVYFDGQSPSEFLSSEPNSIGYVPQSPGLVSGSIRDNIALGIPPEKIDQAALSDAIEASQLADFVAALPGGLSASIGKHTDALSGGQIQRIGLARALYHKPRLLVLDEATSALDAETEAAIASGVELLAGHTTVVIVAHRLSTIQNADNVIVLDRGSIVASGTFAELRNSSALVRDYVRLMSFHE